MQDISLDPLSEFPCPYCGMSVDVSRADSFTRFTCLQCGEEGTVPGRFGPFFLYGQLGESVTGILADAYDPKLGRPISLKILSSVLSKNKEVVAAFKKEALAAASLNSQYVVKVYEFGVHNRQPYMVMEHIEGEFLSEALERGRLNQAQAIELTNGIIRGLKDLHEQGIVHGDVMPRNVLLHKDGGVRISDFGLARHEKEKEHHPSSWSSPYYMPPERIRNEPEDFRGDFYSLGTTLFYMVTGSLPFFDLDEGVTLKRKLNEPAPDPRLLSPDLTPEVGNFIQTLMQPVPENRPGSFEELLEQLDRISSKLPQKETSEPEEIHPAATPSAPSPQNRREAITWFVFLTLAGICLAVILSMITNREDPEDSPSQSLPGAQPTQGPDASVPTPTAASTPIPTATPLPTATPTPKPAPSPTATPAPPSFDRVIEGHIFLTPPNRQPKQRLAKWNVGSRGIFQQDDPQKQPWLTPATDVTPPVILFEGHQLISALELPKWESYTLVTVASVDTSPSSQPRFILGVPSHSSGWTPMGLFTSPSLPGVFAIKTDRGNVNVSIPSRRRGNPFVYAFRRTKTNQDVFIAGRRITLPESIVEKPLLDPDHLLTLHLGAGSDSENGFHGWIGSLFIAEKALSDQELAVVIQKFRELYSIEP